MTAFFFWGSFDVFNARSPGVVRSPRSCVRTGDWPCRNWKAICEREGCCVGEEPRIVVEVVGWKEAREMGMCPKRLSGWQLIRLAMDRQARNPTSHVTVDPADRWWLRRKPSYGWLGEEWKGFEVRHVPGAWVVYYSESWGGRGSEVGRVAYDPAVLESYLESEEFLMTDFLSKLKKKADEQKATRKMVPSKLADTHAGLYQFLTLTHLGKEERKTGTMNVFVEDGYWKSFINDRDNGTFCVVSAPTFEELLRAATEAIEGDDTDWRPNKPYGGPKRKGR